MTPDADDRAAEIARSSALGRAADGGMSGAALLAAMGGVRGVVEALLPGIAFLVLFTVTGDLAWSVGVPVALGVVFILARLVAKQTVMPAVAGLIGAALSGFLALRTGDGADYFIVGFYTNGAYALGFLLSVVIGWPIIGFVAGLLYNARGAWRTNARLKRWMTILTLAWAGFFLLRLAVQLPLFFAGNVVALGVTRLVMGTPMYAVLLVATALFARGAFRAAGYGSGHDEESTRVAD